ncbi:MAG TPA: biotin carboxylase N-terminal domain-containing protein [Myxococcota bacterium]|nr:biotin carboxylase N-terminal domain-containing protein [Myxococcota bacterium]
MIRKLLIANRAEIACRIARTAKRLGARVVAVYSEADAGAAHVRAADEAYLLGPAPPAQSYLDIAKLVAIARRAGCDAVHPGYGFLSENAEFAAAVETAGLAFVGPPPSAIAAMGSKAASKARMAKAGVPVLPGYEGNDQSIARFEREAAQLGFPLIVKPSGGGGGKGMQIVRAAGELKPALETAQRLAARSFGDASLLLERYLPAPRHVEVQVFADAHGRVVHFFDRDCSVQRRHQKLLEEAPAPGIPDAVRVSLHAAACTVAREIAYRGAGTVEFLYADGEFFFMEMNTRLQVEHPVTECVTGLDLVEWQLRVAAGEPLPLAQHQIHVRGHAIEARVCAEDPSKGFVPSAGTLRLAQWPAPERGVRVDAGFESGDVVPTHYDSLLGKVIGSGATRAEAIAQLGRGLAGVRIAGITTNAAWLARASAHPAFRAGEVSTAFVAEHGDALASGADDAQQASIAGAALLAALGPASERVSPWELADGFRVNLPARVVFHLKRGKQELEVAVRREGPAAIAAACGAARAQLDGLRRDGALLRARLAASGETVDAFVAGDRVTVWSGAEATLFHVIDEHESSGGAHHVAGSLATPLPGVVIRVAVKVGERVKAGDLLVVVEAMKMEHAIRAPHDGVVRAVKYQAGERVPEGAALIELETT